MDLRQYIFHSIMIMHAFAWLLVFVGYIHLSTIYIALAYWIPVVILFLLAGLGVSAHYLNEWLNKVMKKRNKK